MTTIDRCRDGFSRGVGKGIAIPWGKRALPSMSLAEASTEPSLAVGGTIAETAAAVTKAGGRGIAVAVDHADDAAVAALFAQIANDNGRLDILVNNAAKLVWTTAPVRSAKAVGKADLCWWASGRICSKLYAAPC